jgi:hypothetical protein
MLKLDPDLAVVLALISHFFMQFAVKVRRISTKPAIFVENVTTADNSSHEIDPSICGHLWSDGAFQDELRFAKFK